MKILTWNLERLQKNKNDLVLDKLKDPDADILILTETNSIIRIGQDYNFVSTKELQSLHDGVNYKDGEIRSAILTKYPILKTHKTFDEYTSVCAEIDTPVGILKVYATIIGVSGGKGERFKSDLNSQLQDFEKLFSTANICLAGDLNTTFSGYVYPSHKAREELNKCFDKFSLMNTTESIFDCVGHIAISRSFVNENPVKIETWNSNKSLSDHIGICIEF